MNSDKTPCFCSRVSPFDPLSLSLAVPKGAITENKRAEIVAGSTEGSGKKAKEVMRCYSLSTVVRRSDDEQGRKISDQMLSVRYFQRHLKYVTLSKTSPDIFLKKSPFKIKKQFLKLFFK